MTEQIFTLLQSALVIENVSKKSRRHFRYDFESDEFDGRPCSAPACTLPTCAAELGVVPGHHG